MPSPASMLSDIYENLSARMQNPFLASFFISACLLNYKIPVVLIGNGTYEDKFKYIETVLYPTQAALRSYFLWTPLLSAIFFAIAWPFINIVINTIRQYAENISEHALHAVKRKTVFDRDLQAQYFKSYDETLDNIKLKLREEQDRNTKYNNEAIARGNELKARVKHQSLMRLAAGVDLAPNDLTKFLEVGPAGVHSEQMDSLRKIAKSPHIKKLGIIFQELDQTPLGENSKRTRTIGWIAELLKTDSDQARDYADFLYSFELIKDVPGDIGIIEVIEPQEYNLAKEKFKMILEQARL